MPGQQLIMHEITNIAGRNLVFLFPEKNYSRMRVMKGGGGGHNPISHLKFFQNPSPSWIFIKNPSRSYQNPSE